MIAATEMFLKEESRRVWSEIRDNYLRNRRTNMPEQALSKLTKAEFKKYMLQGLLFASFAASWTPTPKDDQVIELMGQIAGNQEQFDKLCEIFGITDMPAGATP